MRVRGGEREGWGGCTKERERESERARELESECILFICFLSPQKDTFMLTSVSRSHVLQVSAAVVGTTMHAARNAISFIIMVMYW